MVDQKKFDELVESTTNYLQQLLNRVGALEKEVKELKAKKTISRSAKND
jgi:glycerol-3-phosphate responsive antiterminator